MNTIVGLRVMAALSLVFAGGCEAPSKSAFTEEARKRIEPTETRPFPWRLSGGPDGQSVRIATVADNCDGPVMPRIDRARVNEEAREVTITVFVEKSPEPVRDVPCGGVEFWMTEKIDLEHRIGNRPLYDGSASPPARRWPTAEPLKDLRQPALQRR